MTTMEIGACVGIPEQSILIIAMISEGSYKIASVLAASSHLEQNHRYG